jgi:hypothetical protein
MDAVVVGATARRAGCAEAAAAHWVNPKYDAPHITTSPLHQL